MIYERAGAAIHAHYEDRYETSLEQAVNPGSLPHRLGSLLNDLPSADDCRQAITDASDLLVSQEEGHELASLKRDYLDRTTVTLPEFKQAVGAIGILAALPDETDRNALQALYGYADTKMAQAMSIVSVDELAGLAPMEYDRLQELSHQPYSYQTGLLYNFIRYPLIARAVADVIADPEFVPSNFRDEMYALNNDLAVSPFPPQPGELHPTEATGWTWLRPGEIAEALDPSEQHGGGDSNLPAVMKQRLRFLADVNDLWDDSVQPPRIAAVTLSSDGTKDYWGLILSQTLEDDTIVEHAVVESAGKATATFISRGDAGQNWQEVFNGTRRQARQGGVRKLTHGKYHDENVVEYLSRPLDELERPGYRR